MTDKDSGCDSATVLHKPRLLSDNGPCYIAGDLAEYIEANQMSHVRGAPMHPQTQGKIERWHQTLKNRILLENYFLPGDLEAQIEAFVEHYNNQRYHEALGNVTPAGAYFGRAPAIIKQRERIKRQTIEHRRLQHRKLDTRNNHDFRAVIGLVAGIAARDAIGRVGFSAFRQCPWVFQPFLRISGAPIL